MSNTLEHPIRLKALYPELIRTGDEAWDKFQRTLFEIGRSREPSQLFSVTMSSGQVLWSTRPDHVLRRERRRMAARVWLAEISRGFAAYAMGRPHVKGDKALELSEEAIRHYFKDHSIIEFCQKLDINLPGLLDEIIDAEKTRMRALWPGRGRPSKNHSSARPDELAKQIHLLSMNFKQESLAFKLGIDPKTLRKIERGEAVADRTRDKVWEAIKQLTDKKDQ